MPRINIDDKFFLDPRIALLGEKLGKIELAYGTMLKLFRLAQEYYRENMIIPADIFEIAFPQELLDCHLVEKVDGGYYVKGSSSYFNWINQKIEAGRMGGLKGGKARVSKAERDDKGQFISRAEPEQTQSDALEKTQSTQSEPDLKPQSLIKPLNKVNTLNKEIHTRPLDEPRGSINWNMYQHIWNETADKYKLQKIKAITDSRKRKIKKRLKEPDFDFIKIIEAIDGQGFLLGNSKGGWKVDFDFLIANDSNYMKILEKKYITKGRFDAFKEFYENEIEQGSLPKRDDDSIGDFRKS